MPKAHCKLSFVALLVVGTLGACDCGDGLSGRPPSNSPQSRLDAGITKDAGVAKDAGDEGDSGTLDAANLADSGAIDVGFRPDSGVVPDASTGPDGGANDGGADGGIEDGASDASANDAMPFDSGAPDAGPHDSGGPDASVPDSGSGAGDLWIEISYVSASSPQSPAWRYSVSPGWTTSSWGFNGGNRAEAWDRFNNMSVVSDPIGTVLQIGSSSELQLMFGLVPMSSYLTATVELEGRSRATSSPVQFDVYNPATFCGSSGSMDQDWTPDIVILDLSGCFTPGSTLQAVRVDPTSGTIALRRMRLTFGGAVW